MDEACDSDFNNVTTGGYVAFINTQQSDIIARSGVGRAGVLLP